jgi:hypothetical protein
MRFAAASQNTAIIAGENLLVRRASFENCEGRELNPRRLGDVLAHLQRLLMAA